MAYDASATPAPATHALATRGVANHRRPNHRRQAPGAEKHQPQLRSRSPLPATCVEGSWIDLCCVSRLSPKFKHHHNVQVQIPATASSLPGYRASQCRGMVRAHRAGRRSGTAGHPGREPTERLGDADRAWLPHTRWRRSSIKGSEFSSILKRSGPEEFIATLERQTEQLAMK